ncbi:MAG: calmodulin-binding protein [Planctomycetia bacterium]|nr:calmodulin-binding protein [Planctomycetia bacterium]
MIRPVSAMILWAAVVVLWVPSVEAQRLRRAVVSDVPGISQVPTAGSPEALAPAYNGSWGKNYSSQDWNRFYHYPYIYYPHNFYPAEYYRSADNLYRRYPKEMRIPIYDKKNYNYYAEPKPYHQGFHYLIDVF